MCPNTDQDTVILYLSFLWQDKQSIQTSLFSLWGSSACEKKGMLPFSSSTLRPREEVLNTTWEHMHHPARSFPEVLIFGSSSTSGT